MGSNNHSSGQLRVLSAVVAGNVLELLIDHPLDEDIQPEPEDFTLQLDGADPAESGALEIQGVTLSRSGEDRSCLRFNVSTAKPLSGHLLLTYQPKYCFMYSLVSDDSIGRFDARVALQTRLAEESESTGQVEPLEKREKPPESDKAKQQELFVPDNDAEQDSTQWMRTAGAYITEANEHHIDILFSQSVKSPQPIRVHDFVVELNGISVAVDRSYLHASMHRQEPCLRLDVKQPIERNADVVVSYKASQSGIALADGSVVPHFNIQLEREQPVSGASVGTLAPVVEQQDSDRPGPADAGFKKNVFATKVFAGSSLSKHRIVAGLVLGIVTLAIVITVLLTVFSQPFSEEKPLAVASQNNSAADTAQKQKDTASSAASAQQPLAANNTSVPPVNNAPVKNCKLTYPKGDKYVGQCNANNRPQGQGQYNWVSGSVYTGQWANGKRDGFGTIDYSNGDRYQGDWSANKKHGQGTYWSENGSRYEGEFQNGQFTINGICYMPDGSRITGPCPASTP